MGKRRPGNSPLLGSGDEGPRKRTRASLEDRRSYVEDRRFKEKDERSDCLEGLLCLGVSLRFYVNRVFSFGQLQGCSRGAETEKVHS